MSTEKQEKRRMPDAKQKESLLYSNYPPFTEKIPASGENEKTLSVQNRISLFLKKIFGKKMAK